MKEGGCLFGSFSPAEASVEIKSAVVHRPSLGIFLDFYS